MNPPQIVMGPLNLGRNAERLHRHAQRPARIEHGAHRAILAGTVNALQHDQQRPLAFGKKPVLQAVNGRRILEQLLLGLVLVIKGAVIARIMRGQVKISCPVQR